MKWHSACVQWLMVCSFIFLSSEIHKASCDSFYIVTALSNPCPDEFAFEQCLTLQRFSNSFLESQNVMLIMESGTHSLISVSFIIANRRNFTMVPADENGNPRISCNGGSTTIQDFTLNSISHIQIQGVSFDGCTSTLGNNGNSVIISDVSFTSSKITIQNIVDSVQLMRVNFTNSPRGRIETFRNSTRIQIKDTIFTGLDAVEVCEAAEITVIDSIVQQVSRSLVLLRSSKVNVVACQFLNNNVGSERIGGGLFLASATAMVKDSIFSNNFANSGSAIAFDGVNLTVNGSLFTSNTGEEYGCIYPRSGRSQLTVINSVFTTNTARTGAAIAAFNINVRLIMHIINSSFRENKEAISTSQAEMITITNSNFLSNFGNEKGGAISDEGTKEYTITGCLFESNMVNTRRNGIGGAITMGRTSLVLLNSNFDGNFAAREGGAIHTTGPLTARWTNFTNNVATNRGGAVNVRSLVGNTTVILSNCYLSDNRAELAGGGALHVDSDSTAIYIDNSHFARNTATVGSGGAIHQEGQFTNISLVDSTFDSNSATSCGVVDIDDIQHRRVDFFRSTFTSNRATGTGTSDGGGVLCVSIASISLTDCTFSNNSAQHGGVLNVDDSNIGMDRCSFVNNAADLNGGVAYTNENPATYSVRLSIFLENSAGGDGGALYLGIVRNRVNIERSSFGSNSAGNRGGMVAINGSQLVIDNQTNIFDNTADMGPAISACNSELVTSSELTLTETDNGCKFYKANINSFNISEFIHQELSITTAPEIIDTTLPVTTNIESSTTSDVTNPRFNTGSTENTRSPPDTTRTNTPSNHASSTHYAKTATLAMCMTFILAVSLSFTSVL